MPRSIISPQKSEQVHHAVLYQFYCLLVVLLLQKSFACIQRFLLVSEQISNLLMNVKPWCLETRALWVGMAEKQGGKAKKLLLRN